MKKFISKELAIGIAVIISLVLLFSGIEYLKGINLFKPANFYYVKYNNVSGLAVSAPVTINGYQIGLVRDINYEYNDGNLYVELSLDKKLKIPVGSKAIIKSDMLGTASIALELSKEKQFYNIGDEIPGANEKGLMDNIANEVLPSVTNLIPKIDSILSNINIILANPALTNSINRLDNITANLDKSSEHLAKIMGRSVPAILYNVNDISKNLNTITADLNQVSTDLKNMPLDSTFRNINAITENIKDVTNRINGTNSTLGLLINDRSMYDHLNGTIVNLDSIIIDLRKNPKKYVNFKLF